MSIQLRKSEEKNRFYVNACVSQIKYQNSNVNISRKVLKRNKWSKKHMMNIETGKTQTETENIKQSIDLILKSTKGERVLNRGFGSSLVSYLGKPVSQVFLQVTGEVVRALEQGDSRIDVDNASVLEIDHEDYSLTIDISYNTGQTTQVEL